MEISSRNIASIQERLGGLFNCSNAYPGHLRSGEPDFTTSLDEVFNALALDLFWFQYHSNPAYRLLCDSRRIGPESIERWQEIPAVITRAFKDFEFSCLPPGERTRVFYSSGTTEQRPSRHFHNDV